MSAQTKKRWTVEEYLALERSSDEKHEFIDGEVYAMSGASLKHNRIVGSTYASLFNQLVNKPCEPLPSDMLVKINQRNYTYPDISVVCGKAQLEPDAPLDTLLNPTLIVEVLSPSTEKYDRGKKFDLYRTLPSLQEYLLIAQDEYRIERYLRQSDGNWVFTAGVGIDASIELPSISAALKLVDVYRQVTFEDETP